MSPPAGFIVIPAESTTPASLLAFQNSVAATDMDSHTTFWI
jgi:hypothetical protein